MNGTPDDAGELTADLVRAARADAGRFADLYSRIAPAVYAWATLRVPAAVRGRIDPEDVVQESWLVALRKFSSFDPARASFRTWIFGVANHVLRDRFRGARRDDLRRDDAALSAVADAATSLSRRVARDERTAAFLAEAEGLDADERALLVHLGLEGLTAKEAAELLGASPAAIEKRWQRLRARLRARFAETGFVD